MLAAVVKEAVRDVVVVVPVVGLAVRAEPGRSFCVPKGETSFLWNRKIVY